MDITIHLADVNWLAVVVATVAAFLLGAVWYSNTLFGAKWMQEIGLTEDSIQNGNMAKIFGTTFVLQFIATTGLAILVGKDASWLTGLHMGSMVGLLWVATAYGVTYLFEQRTVRLWLINAGYYVVLYAITGTILGAWPG